MPTDVRHAYYVTALDRIGLAILAGGVLTGLIAMLLMLGGGQRSPMVLALGWMAGTGIGMVGIVAVAGPVWIILHRNNWRGPGVAAITGGALALLVFTTGQMLGSGGDGYRWASALATSSLLALAAAAIGIAMQRVAYRRLL